MPLQLVCTADRCLAPRTLFFLIAVIAVNCFSCKHKKVENPDHPAYASDIIDSANNLLDNGQRRMANVYLDSAYHAFPKPGPQDLWKKYSYRANYYLNYDIIPAKAKLYVDSMFMAIKGVEQSYKEEYTSSVFANGDVLMAKKSYNEAFKCYYDGHIYALKNLSGCSIYQYSYRLGLIRYNQGQYLKAIPYFKLSYEESNDCNLDNGFAGLFVSTQSSLNTIAMCYEKAERPDSAVYYYEKALRFIDERAVSFKVDEQFIERARGVIYGNLGGAYTTLNNFGKAEKYLKESIRINNRTGYEMVDALTAEIKLANLYIRLSKFTVASQLLKNIQRGMALQENKHGNNVNILVQLLKLKWHYADSMHQIHDAYLYAQKYYQLRDSVVAVEHGLRNIDMDVAFKSTEQQNRFALLNKDNEIKRLSLRTIIVLSLMVLIILFIIWYNLIRYLKVNLQINTQNLQLRNALNALELSQKDNTRMMTIVAHDLRNPVAANISIASLLLEKGTLPSEDQELLKLMKVSSEQAIDLITNLLSMHTSPLVLDKETVKIQTLLRYVVDMLRFKANEKNQKITLKTMPLTIQADRGKLWRVFSNIIGNAIKFSPKDAIIDVWMQKDKQNLYVNIRDCGIGIPEDIQNKVFDMFTDAKRAGTSGEVSYGLGLAISRQIIEAHGGTIHLESKPGTGTTFFITIPL